MSGRFAPSPTGELHLGNLRTAAVAWLSARALGSGFLIRIEDLDRQRSRPEHERSQLNDLAAIGIDWDGEVVRQSERFGMYHAAIDRLRVGGHVYECFCTRRQIREEIQAAPSAPHLPPGSYPGTCRDLSDARRAALRASGRSPALRLRAGGQAVEFSDRLSGSFEGALDDFVLRRSDGTPAYNLAVVVDDADQSISEVVRGDDLLSSTPRQIVLQRLLGYATPEYVHVPLVVNDADERLSKRDGAVTIGSLAARGVDTSAVVDWIAVSLGLAAPGERISMDRLVDRFDLASIPGSTVTPPGFVS